MKQKTRIASKLFAALVVLTLISCCFLGTTMARYTSAGTGTAKVEVAKWDIDIGNDGVANVSFSKLSPNMEDYDGGDMYDTESARKNVNYDDTAGNAGMPKLAAVITNSGEVDAKVTVGYTGPGFKDSQSQAVTDFGKDGKLDLTDVFTIQLYYGTSKMWEESYASNVIDPGVTEMSVAATNGSIYIFATVTWTSDTASCFGPSADVRDTWIGENIASVEWALTFTAVQASELPTT